MATTTSLLAALCLVLVQGKEVPLDDICINCICEATSGCDKAAPEADCNEDTCGVYALPKIYWQDGGKLLVEGDDGSDEDEAFRNCGQNVRCAEAIVHNYMVRYSQDCNNDGDVDCYDYAAIHRRGGFGCRAGLDEQYSQTVNRCIQAARNLTAPQQD